MGKLSRAGWAGQNTSKGSDFFLMGRISMLELKRNSPFIFSIP